MGMAAFNRARKEKFCKELSKLDRKEINARLKSKGYKGNLNKLNNEEAIKELEKDVQL